MLASQAIRRIARGGQALAFRGAADPDPVCRRLVRHSEDEGVPARTLTVALLGMSSRVPGQLHEGFGAAVAGGFGHHVTVGIGFAGERGQRGRDDQPGFRVEPAVQAPHPADRFGQVQMLRRPFTGGFFVGGFGGGGGEQFRGQRFELFDRQPGGMVGQEPFQVQCQVVAQAADRIRDDLRMIHPELPGLPDLPGHRHGVRKRPAEPDPPARPGAGFPGQVLHVLRRGRGAVGGEGAGAVDPFDQPARQKLTLTDRTQDLRQHFGCQHPGGVGGDRGGELAREGVQLGCFRGEL